MNEEEVKNSKKTNLTKMSSICDAVKRFISKKYLFVLLLIILFFSVIAYFFINNKEVEEKTPISQNTLPPQVENVLIATVGDKQIKREDVLAIALESYAFSAINSEVLKKFVEIAVERSILDSEAELLSLNIEKNEKKFEYYESVKSELINRRLGTVTANMVSYWVPAFGDIYPQKPEYQEMRDLEEEVFNSVKTSFEEGKSSYEIGTEILEKYPVFREQLSVNGYRLIYTDDKSLMQNPVTYDYLVNDSNQLLLDFMHSMEPGEVEVLTWPDGEGAATVQLIEKSSGAKKSYNEWLKEKKAEVKYETQNIEKL